MPHRAVGAGFNQRGSIALPGPCGRLLHNPVDGQHVVAVHGFPGDAVGGRAAGDAGVAGGRGQWRAGGIEIVFADEHHRRRQGSRQVEGLVKGAVADGSVPEEGHRNAAAAAHFFRQRRAHRGRNAGPDQPVGPQQAGLGVIQVHAAATAAVASRRSAGQLGQRLLGRQALGQRMAVAAMGAGDGILPPQVGAHPDGRGFLAHVEVNEAGNLPGPVEALHPQFEPSDQHHPFIEPELGGVVHRRGRPTFLVSQV